MSPARQFQIAFAPGTSKSVAAYVVRGFFSRRELPQALARMMLTAEFGWFIAIPLALLLIAHWLAAGLPDAAGLAPLIEALAVLWLLAGLWRIARYGKSAGIGCFALDSESRRGALVGGLRLRLERRRRKIWIAGLLVEPSARGNGIGTALVLAAIRLAELEAARGPVGLEVFAPSHPASKAIVAQQLGGRKCLQVSVPISDDVQLVIQRLEASLANSAGSGFRWQLDQGSGGLFDRRVAGPYV